MPPTRVPKGAHPRFAGAAQVPVDAGPGFVIAHVIHDIEPVGDKLRGLVAVIDLGDEGAVFVLVACDDQPVPMTMCCFLLSS